MTLVLPEQKRQCVTCQSATTYVYKGHERWHRTADGSYQCHACYSTRSKKVQPAEDPQAAETEKRMEKARQEVRDAKDPEAMRKACKSFTNYIEPIQRKEREAAKVQ